MAQAARTDQTAQTVESTTQSAGKSGNIEDLALIEEHIDPGLSDLLAGYEPVQKLEDIPTDILNDRFTIQPGNPVAEFDSGAAKAFHARDAAASDRQLLAFVCDPQIPYRQSAIDTLRGVTHPNITTLRDAGSVRLSDSGQVRLVLFTDRPQGQRLSGLFAGGKRFSERQVIDQLLTPLIEGLGALHEKGVCHGRINPRELFVGQRLALNECVSETQGLSQDPLYEPLERLMADPMAKGAATSKSDAYAIGMLAYEALFGLERFRELQRSDLIRLMLEKGSFHAYVVNKDVSEGFSDFFRGIFTENKQERWGLEQLQQWLSGKRFNLIMPSLPGEASRPFEFNERQFFSCRALAYSLFNNWPAAVKQIRRARLDRWLEMSAHKADMAEKVARIIRSSGGDYGTTERANNDMLSRLITTLDPIGPVRSRSISVNVDGLGLAIAQYYKQRDHASIQLLIELIEADLPTYWADLTEMEKTPLTQNILWILQRIRAHIKQQQMGFGLERLVYDLNPSLPCQNEWLMPYHATTAEEALVILDNLAKDKAPGTALAERHLIAFLASKIELAKEVKFTQLAKLPGLRNHPELIALRIISMAQDKKGKTRLVGLSTWAAMRLDTLIENIHSRRLRRKIRENLKAAAKTGLVSRVLAVLVENDLTKDDYAGFTRANAVYLNNVQKIDALQNQQMIDGMARDLGGRIAVFTAYMILTIAIYFIVDHYHFY